jgi:exopolysaccharide biosynthesis polyprenyl glycosylphosphotransferase
MMFHKGQSISWRRTVLLTADVISIAGSILLSAFMRLTPNEGWDYCLQHWPSLVGSLGVFLVVFYASGLYERQALTRKEASYLLPLVATTVSLMLIVLIFYARFQLNIGRGILLLAGLFVFLSSWGMRYLYRQVVRSGFLSKNTLIVGEGKEVEDVLNLLSHTADSGLRVLGIVSTRRVAVGTFMGPVPVVGSVDKLREFADALDAETIIVATSVTREASVLRLLRPLRCSGTEVMDFVTLHEVLAQEIPLDHINDEWLMNAAMNSSVIHIRKIKRILDFAVALFGMVVTAPIFLVAYALVKLDSPGPALYRQRRSGLDGRTYTLMKFRTMRQDAEALSGAVWAGQADNRVTRTGHLMRSWRVDELPQLINVLRGEMSLVGPRPERPEFVETLAQAIPFYRERLLVPPGITGWAQVKYPYAASIEAARRKLQYDLYYIKHMSFFLDILILLRTFKTIVVGLRHSGESAPVAVPVVAPDWDSKPAVPPDKVHTA